MNVHSHRTSQHFSIVQPRKACTYAQTGKGLSLGKTDGEGTHGNSIQVTVCDRLLLYKAGDDQEPQNALVVAFDDQEGNALECLCDRS